MKRSADETSKLLGEKMLQGWTMLGATCPVNDCYTPLMRDKQGKMLCVRCDQFVVPEMDVKKQQSEQEAMTASAVKKEEENEDEIERWRKIEQRFCLEEQAKKTREVQELEQAKPQRSMTANVAAKRKIEHAVDQTSPNGDADVNAIRRQTLAALYQYIEAPWLRISSLASLLGQLINVRVLTFALTASQQKMGALVDSLSPNDHSERLIAVTKALREIAETAQLLKQ